MGENVMYLTEFRFPDSDQEFSFFMEIKRTCYDSFYPFQVLSAIGFSRMDFEPVTILYGGNGCGKSTALNVIAGKLGLRRQTAGNSSNFFGEYLRMCSYESCGRIPKESCILTSDDVFDFMLDLRALNEGIDRKREEVFEEYLDAKYADFHFRTMADYDRLKQVNLARSKTQSKYVRRRLMDNVREHSNGESAFLCFTDRIRENALYLLDEPENSLSAARQLELAKFLEDSARFFGCQLVISTHSPFLLAMPGARVYDLDSRPVRPRRWTELPSVRAYYEFFRDHAAAFEP